MNYNEVLQIIIFLSVVLLLAKPLGGYMAYIYQGKYSVSNNILVKIEYNIYKFCNILPEYSMSWQQYAKAALSFGVLNFMLVYLLLRMQNILPFKQISLLPVRADIAFNTAASFITNTNWQVYAGESTLSYFSQMVALTVQNFISAATGCSILLALIRGIVAQDKNTLGNFWVDTFRGILYIFLPISLLLSFLLVSQGVPHNLKKYIVYNNCQQTKQLIPQGPVASQIAIKQLGTNGGGFFNANSSHPFENPTPFSNFLEMLAIIMIPAALCYTFGIMIKDIKHGRNLLITMLLILIPCLILAIVTNKANMEGKELRFGILNSSLWSIITTATSNGSTNAVLDSFLPLTQLISLWLMNIGVIFGGVGSGLYQMLMLVFITVFIAGLMIGRTPEYLGKKIEPYEMKMVSIAILIIPLLVLICSAIAISTDAGKQGVINKGIHGFTEILHAFSSMANNNGSMLSGLNINNFYNILGGIVMLAGRYFVIIPVLAIAGSLAQKKIIPVNAGTMPINSVVFLVLLIGVIFIITALIFLPAFSQGPIIESLYASKYFN